jgi:hypothetical protein
MGCIVVPADRYGTATPGDVLLEPEVLIIPEPEGWAAQQQAGNATDGTNTTSPNVPDNSTASLPSDDGSGSNSSSPAPPSSPELMSETGNGTDLSSPNATEPFLANMTAPEQPSDNDTSQSPTVMWPNDAGKSQAAHLPKPGMLSTPSPACPHHAYAALHSRYHICAQQMRLTQLVTHR